MRNINLVLVLIAYLIKIALCGNIDVMDYTLLYTNINDVSEMKFIFSLENGLGTNNFLRLSFPIALSSVASSVTNIKVTYQFQGSNSCSQRQKFHASIIYDGPSNDYLFQFYDDTMALTSLLPSPSWYALNIVPDPLVAFTAGQQKPITARTQSIDTVPAVYGTPIIYDFTNMFGVLEFDADPATTVVIDYVIASTYSAYQYVVGKNYEISFVITPNLAINNGGRFMILIYKDQGFRFIGNCISEEHTNGSTTIPALDSLDYTCTVDLDYNRIIIELKQDVPIGQIYRFRTTMLNPSHVTILPIAGIEIRTMLISSNKIIERAIISGILYTNEIFAVQKVIMGNGIDLASATYSQSAAIISGYNFFNPFQFQFTTSITTPDDAQLQVNFKMPIDMTNDIVLQGSIQHNFPRFNFKTPVQCLLVKMATYYNIQCTQIGPLSLFKEYFVTVRVSFQSAGTLSSFFGSVSVYTIDNSGNLSLLIKELPHVFGSSTIQPNLNLVDTTTPIYSYQMFHSQISYDSSNTQLSLSQITSTSGGIKSCASSTVRQKLVITLTFTAETAAAATLAGTDQAMSLITTPLIQGVPNSGGSKYLFETLDGGCNALTDLPDDYNKMITSTNYNTQIFLTSYGTSPCVIPTSGTKTYSIGDVYITGSASAYAGREAFDFYGALFVNYVSGATPTLYFGVNSFTISMAGAECTSSRLSNINIGLSNFQTSSGGQTQLADGTKYTAFIRITGYLGDDEKSNVRRIAVFFDNVNFYSIGLDTYGQNKVSCSSSMNVNQQCWGYSGVLLQSTSIFSMNRVEFDVSSFISETGPSSPFQLLIPVQAIAEKPASGPNPAQVYNIQRIFVSTLARNPYYGALTQAYISQYTISYWKIITGSIAATYSPLSDLSYQLIVTSKTQGQQENADLKIGHANTVPNIIQNNPSANANNIGSAFVIVGNWKMYSNTLTVTSTGIVNTDIKSEGCLSFSYLISGAYKYGIFCPFTIIASTQTIVSSSQVTFSNFVFPALGTSKLAGTYISWSQSTGQLISVLQDSTLATETLLANKITQLSSITLRKFAKDNRVAWLFTTSNPFPMNGKIYIKLDDSSGTVQFPILTSTLARCILYKQTGNFQETACSVGYEPANVRLVFSFTATKDFSAGSYKLVQYGISSLTTSLSAQYSIIVRTATNSGSFIDASGNTMILSQNNAFLLAPPIDIKSSLFTHSFISNSYGNYDLIFKMSDRPILALSTPGAGLISGQFIELNIPHLAGQESTISCQVWQNNKIYFGFKSIDQANAASFKLFPRNDILDENLIFQFKCLNVKNTANSLITANLIYQNSLISITGNFPLIATSYTNPVSMGPLALQTYNGLSGALFHYLITASLSANPLTPQSSLMITFPDKYSHRVGAQTLYCKINSKPTYCINFLERKIQVSGFPSTISAGTSFTLEVYGVYGPQSVYGAGTIQMSFSTSRDPANVKEQSFVNDPATSIDIAPTLIVNYATQTNYISRELGVDYEFNAILKVSGIASGQYLYLEFPREFGTSITALPPTTCVVQSISGAVIQYGTVFENFGTNLMIKISTSIPINTEFKIKISSLLTPEDSGCKITKTIISVLSSDRKQVNARSTVGSSNQPQIRSSYNSDLGYINWYQQSQQVKFNEDVLTIIAGSYSNIISLKDSNSSLHKMVTFVLQPDSSAQFSLISDLNIYPGQISEDLRIGCPTVTVPSLFTLIFTKTEIGTPLYGSFSLLNVKVSDAVHIIAPEFTTYYVFSGGNSIPILFDLTEMIPYDDVSVLFQIKFMGLPSIDPKIELIDENGFVVTELTLNFSPDNYKGKIQVRSLVQMTATSNHNSKLIMTIFGTDAASYSAGTVSTILQLISQTPIPSLSYSQDIDQVSPKATIQNVTISANLPITVYYHVRLQIGPSRPLAEVRNLIDAQVVLNPIDYYQEQFGLFNYQGQGASIIYQIPKLRSKLTYTITTWVIDSLQRVTQGKNTIFSTKNNDGRVLRLPIEFQTDITKLQKTKIGCYMCQKFAIPCLNVISFDNIYCSSYSQFTLSIQDPVNAGYQRRLLVEVQENQLESTHQRNLASSSLTVTVPFYSLSIDEYNSDLSWSTILSIVKSSDFESEIAALDSTLPSIVKIGVPFEIVKQTAQLFFVNLPTIEAGSTWIYFTGIETNQRSLIWLYLVDYSDGGTPSPQQMKFMLTSRNATSPNFFIYLYNMQSTISHNFTGLIAETQYALYMLATSENPSLFTQTTSVSYVGQKTKAEDSSKETWQDKMHPNFILGALLIFVSLM